MNTVKRYAYLGTEISKESWDYLQAVKARMDARRGGSRSCSCGCGKIVTNYSQECTPVAPWDTPGLPPRAMHERCANHALCAYRDDEPVLCPGCHTIPERCTCPKAKVETPA
jgi:hypothetical protein